MRLREKQRIFRRFMAGESLHQIRMSEYDLFSAAIESIIREGVTKGWPTGLEVKDDECPDGYREEIATDGCLGCAFEASIGLCDSANCCSSITRKDKRNVIFKTKGGAK